VDVDTLTWLREQGVRYHTMAEIDRRGFPAVLARVLDAVDRGPARIFVSIDVSVIEPSEMIAAGRLAANGLGVRQVASAIRHLCAARETVGFEITDVAPMLDNTRASVMNANTMLNACLAGMAVRAAGHSPEFIHPLSIDHGKD
jgi:agmatinase